MKRIPRRDGFALPSVLMLVAVLSILALSLVLVQHFHHTAVQREVSRLKADLAAQNGVTWAAAAKKIGNEGLSYSDGTDATVDVWSWGVYRLVLSRGTCSKTVSSRSALLGQRQAGLFKDALVYFNPQHQLVFAGEVQVVGDVQAGAFGATLGVLEDTKSLPGFPVTGEISTDASFAGFELPELLMQINAFDSLLKAAGDNDLAAGGEDAIIQLSTCDNLGEIAGDKSTLIVLEGNQDFSGKVVRQGHPLRILVLGSVNISAGAAIYGPVQVLSTGPMTISSDIHIEYPILYSQKSIETLASCECKAQLISPNITIGRNSKLDYPSALVSWITPDSIISGEDTTGKSEPRALTLLEGAVVEGAVLMNPRANPLKDPDLIVITPASRIIGSVYCGEKITFDGKLTGTVITNDFYFYESPTKYFGWIRNGLIDREHLPAACLTPVGLVEDDAAFRVLDWI